MVCREDWREKEGREKRRRRRRMMKGKVEAGRHGRGGSSRRVGGLQGGLVGEGGGRKRRGRGERIMERSRRGIRMIEGTEEAGRQGRGGSSRREGGL